MGKVDGKTYDPDISEDVKITLFYRFGIRMTMNCEGTGIARKRKHKTGFRRGRFGLHQPIETTYPVDQICMYKRYIYIYMRVVLNSFIWKTSSSPKNNYFAELSRTPRFSFAVHVGQDF